MINTKKFYYGVKFCLSALCLLGALTFSSCGNDDDDPTDDPATPGNTTDPTNNPNGNDPSLAAATQIGGIYGQGLVLKDLGLPVDYVVVSTVTVRNDPFTVEPGVTIQFSEPDQSIVVEESSVVSMKGTANAPICLQGAENQKGSWRNFEIKSAYDDNTLEYVIMKNGGRGDYNDFPVLVLRGDYFYSEPRASVKHCLIDGGSSNGIELGSGAYFTAFENNTIKNCDKFPLSIYDFARNYKNFGENNDMESNGLPYINVESAAFEAFSDITIKKESLPFFMERGAIITSPQADRITVTVEPGVMFYMNDDTYWEIDEDIQFNAIGTSSKPIVWQSANSGRRWAGIVAGYYSEHITLDNCMIKNCGYNESQDNANACGLYLSKYVSFTEFKNVTIEDCNTAAVKLYNTQSKSLMTVENFMFVNCTKNVYVQSRQLCFNSLEDVVPMTEYEY